MFSIESSTQKPSPLSVLFCVWHNRKGSCASLHHWVYSNAQPGCVVGDRRNVVPLCDVLWKKVVVTHGARYVSLSIRLVLCHLSAFISNVSYSQLFFFWTQILYWEWSGDPTQNVLIILQWANNSPHKACCIMNILLKWHNLFI